MGILALSSSAMEPVLVNNIVNNFSVAVHIERGQLRTIEDNRIFVKSIVTIDILVNGIGNGHVLTK